MFHIRVTVSNLMDFFAMCRPTNDIRYRKFRGYDRIRHNCRMRLWEVKHTVPSWLEILAEDGDIHSSDLMLTRLQKLNEGKLRLWITKTLIMIPGTFPSGWIGIHYEMPERLAVFTAGWNDTGFATYLPMTLDIAPVDPRKL